MKKVSITVPCYNEVGNVRDMAETLMGIMQGLPYEYEIIFTDNCSTDGTKDILRELAAEDDHIKVLMNSRNYGTDGRSDRNTLRYVRGDVYIAIPCDFQEPPELIPEFIKAWEDGYKVVCGQKESSKEGVIKYSCRSLFYKIIKGMSDTPQYEHISGIVLLDREVLCKNDPICAAEAEKRKILLQYMEISGLCDQRNGDDIYCSVAYHDGGRHGHVFFLFCNRPCLSDLEAVVLA